MATQEEIFAVRLRIKDPEGFIGFIEVADVASIPVSPAVPASQTAYKTTLEGNYYSTTKAAPTATTDYNIVELYVSDSTLSLMIDTYGSDGATCKALDSIISSIAYEMRGLKSNGAGADKTDYQNLKDVIEVYKYLRSLCNDTKKSNENNSSGRYLKTFQPTIAGGNI